MCVWGGGGLVTSFKVNFNFPKFQGVQHMLSGGGGRQTFFQGGGVQLLKPHSHCADVAPVHHVAGQPVYRDAPGHIL